MLQQLGILYRVLGILRYSPTREMTKSEIKFSPFITCPTVYLKGVTMRKKVETFQS